MTLSKKPYRGTRDFFPPQKRIQNYLFNKMKNSANLFGFEEYDGPILEEVALYQAKSGQELIKDQIYSFIDRGERFVAIRPEMTPTLARMVSQKHREIQKPIRWFSIPNLMRYEKPQRGRLREHWQLNADIFGCSSPAGIFETLSLLIFLLKDFGATDKHFCILLNNRKIVDHLFNKKLNLSSELSYKLYKLIDKSKKIGKEKLQQDLETFNLSTEQNLLFLNYLKLKSFEELYSFSKEHNLYSCEDEIIPLLKMLSSTQLQNYIIYDPTIVRGLDYYTGFVFEVFDKNPENPRAICGGGEYANLLKIFNEDSMSGVGFGLGDVTLTDFLTTHKLLPDFSTQICDLYLTYQDDEALNESLKLSLRLREKSIKVITHPEKLKFKKVFPNAQKNGAKFVGMIGSNELEKGIVQIKNLNTRDQFDVKLDDLSFFQKIFNIKEN